MRKVLTIVLSFIVFPKPMTAKARCALHAPQQLPATENTGFTRFCLYPQYIGGILLFAAGIWLSLRDMRRERRRQAEEPAKGAV